MIRKAGIPLVLCLLIGSSPSIATSCALQGLEVFPQHGTTIPSNPVFILQASGAISRNLVDLEPDVLTLQGPTGSSAVKIIRAGGSSTRFLFVRPVQDRLPRGRYTLLIGGKSWANSAGDPRPVAAWTVRRERDLSRPSFLSVGRPVPRVSPEIFGSGLSVDLKIESDKTPVAVVVRLDEIEDGFPLRAPNEVVLMPGATSLFRNQCGSNAVLRRGKHYLAALSLVDAAGNESEPPARLAAFEIPKE